MRIIGIEPVSAGRSCVRIEGAEAVTLYSRELKKYAICEGEELSELSYEEIIDKVLKPRAVKRAMHLLERSDRTEKELRERLEKDGCPSACIEHAISYVQRYGYLDDDRYMEVFIRSRSARKSRREIGYLLEQKGFPKEVVTQKLDSMQDEVNDSAAIEALLRKKKYDPDCPDRKEKDRIIQYLMRKGFRYQDICHVIQILQDDA